jgi:magnesium transporter
MPESLIVDAVNLKWHHFDEPDDPELVVLAAHYSLHELALEDCRTISSRAKLDDYGDYLFIVLNAPYFVAEQDKLRDEKLSIFVGAGFAITVSEGINKTIDHAKAVVKTPWIWERSSKDILYILMDSACDQFLPTIDAISEEISELEQKVYEKPDEEISRRATSLKKVLTLLRRTATSHREIINQLLRKNPPVVEGQLHLYFRDIYDHLLQATDLIETDRDLLTGIIDINMSVTAHRTNEIVKTLTIYATALLPLNVITGYFGMNFDRLPLIHDRLGVPLVTALLVLMVIGTATYFRRREW